VFTEDKSGLSQWENLLVMVNNEERWRQLCAKAAVEQDPQRLMELVKEISRLLDEKQTRNRIEPKATGHSNDDPLEP
jgi:hypothetical protein